MPWYIYQGQWHRQLRADAEPVPDIDLNQAGIQQFRTSLLASGRPDLARQVAETIKQQLDAACQELAENHDANARGWSPISDIDDAPIEWAPFEQILCESQHDVDPVLAFITQPAELINLAQDPQYGTTPENPYRVGLVPEWKVTYGMLEPVGFHSVYGLMPGNPAEATEANMRTVATELFRVTEEVQYEHMEKHAAPDMELTYHITRLVFGIFDEAGLKNLRDVIFTRRVFGDHHPLPAETVFKIQKLTALAESETSLEVEKKVYKALASVIRFEVQEPKWQLDLMLGLYHLGIALEAIMEQYQPTKLIQNPLTSKLYHSGYHLCQPLEKSVVLRRYICANTGISQEEFNQFALRAAAVGHFTEAFGPGVILLLPPKFAEAFTHVTIPFLKHGIEIARDSTVIQAIPVDIIEENVLRPMIMTGELQPRLLEAANQAISRDLVGVNTNTFYSRIRRAFHGLDI